MLEINRILGWSEWLSLEGCWRGERIPPRPGLYRIRRSGRTGLDYIGQTGEGGMNLRARLAMLRGVYGPEMPYRDPHTAAPGLWALLRTGGAGFEVSFAMVEGTTAWRKGLEALAIALYRQEHLRSPTLNFGRMPPAWRMSSGNNLRIKQAGNFFRGGPTDRADASHNPSIPPAGRLGGLPQSDDWGGYGWSPWVEVSRAARTAQTWGDGLYRVRDSARPGLLYVGQGRIAARLRGHLRKLSLPANAQGQVFREASALEASWVANEAWQPNQRLELENDLIAAHVLVIEAPPPAQFLGKSL